LFGGYGLALATLALVVFGAIECPPFFFLFEATKMFLRQERIFYEKLLLWRKH